MKLRMKRRAAFGVHACSFFSSASRSSSSSSASRISSSAVLAGLAESFSRGSFLIIILIDQNRRTQLIELAAADVRKRTGQLGKHAVILAGIISSRLEELL